MKFMNPQNGYVEEVSDASWLWCLLFGGFYFAFKGIWIHFVIGIGAALLTWGISWLIYPIFARSIIIAHYQKSGWQEVPENEIPNRTSSATESIEDLEPWRKREKTPKQPIENLEPWRRNKEIGGNGSSSEEPNHRIIEVYRGFDICAVKDGFEVLGKVHGKLSEARASVDDAYK